MANKVFGVKNITHLLYGIIVLLPMFAILGRVIYTQSNPNAKDSYSNQLYQERVNIASYNSLVNGETYYFKAKHTYTTSNVLSRRYYYSNSTFNYTDMGLVDREYNSIRIVDLGSTTQLYYWMYYDETHYQQIIVPNTSQYLNFTITLSDVVGTESNLNADIYYDVFTPQKLDNAFEYSLKTFTDDNNLGEVDMFSWFTDLFLDHNNPHNQIYIGFVNWYLNYTMLVSCGYLFFLVLIWFINFIRRILDKSMYQDYGGF